MPGLLEQFPSLQLRPLSPRCQPLKSREKLIFWFFRSGVQPAGSSRQLVKLWYRVARCKKILLRSCLRGLTQYFAIWFQFFLSVKFVIALFECKIKSYRNNIIFYTARQVAHLHKKVACMDYFSYYLSFSPPRHSHVIVL